MDELFSKIVEMTVTGSIVILITMFARFLLRKRSKRFIMILWIVVAMRLLVPINIESSLSIFNYLPFKTNNIGEIANVQESNVPDYYSDPRIVTTEVVAAPAVQDDYTAEMDGDAGMPEVNMASADQLPDIRTVLSIVWFAGTAGIASCCSIRFVLLKKKLMNARNIGDNVFVSDKITAPFVFGIFAPGIYLPDILEDSEKEYILLHEKTHIRHGDQIRKIVGMFIVAVHWFNPLVWIAYTLFEQDIEMRCDESVVADMDADMKSAYMMSIVSYAKMSSNKRYLVTQLGFSRINFSKTEVTNRVKNIIYYKKGKALTAAAITVVMLFVGLGCSLNSKTDIADENDNTNGLASETSEPAQTEDTSDTPETDVPDDFVSFVKSFAGCPYEYGGSDDNGFDDSGLITYCYAVYYGISLPHGNNPICNEAGRNVAMDDLRIGDIICYEYGNACGHVAIYIGDGQVIHASNTEGSVCYGDLDMMSIRAIKRIVE